MAPATSPNLRVDSEEIRLVVDAVGEASISEVGQWMKGSSLDGASASRLIPAKELVREAGVGWGVVRHSVTVIVTVTVGLSPRWSLLRIFAERESVGWGAGVGRAYQRARGRGDMVLAWAKLLT